MQHRIATITQKLQSLAGNITGCGLIDVDLMLDYTRVLYADLLELRQSMAAQRDIHIHEPTLDELTEAMLAQGAEAGEEEAETESEPPAPAAPMPSVFSPNPFSHKQQQHLTVPVTKKLLFEDMIGINDRYLFQQELFHNDHVLYHKAIEAINTAATLDEVNEWLEKHISNHRHWDLYGEAGSTFYAILNRYFEQR